MALIYANAVNKRMGSALRPKKSTEETRTGSPCPYHKHKIEQTMRKRSATNSGHSSSLENTHAHANGTQTPSPRPEHRAVQRSKTTMNVMSKCENARVSRCPDKEAAEEVRRKRSTPAMGGCPHKCKMSENERIRTEMAKKKLIEKYDLEHDVKIIPSMHLNKDSRRRSASNDRERSNKKENAFARMKRKFSNWKMQS